MTDVEIRELSEPRTTARVISEPRTYGLRSPWSFVQDVASLSTPDQSKTRIHERMVAYGKELAFEIDRGSREGMRAERVLRAQYRGVDSKKHAESFDRAMRELRNLTTGGGSTATASSGGAAFVSPYFMWDEWAPFRGVTRSFADQCDKLPLPAYGMQVYLPAFSSTTSVTQQTEGQAISETDPSTSLLASGTVQTITGQITLSQQISDRGFSGGGTFDRLVGKQLQQQLDQQVDVYTLTQALATAPVVSGMSVFSVSGVYQDQAAAREVLTDTAGTRLRPTHVFSTSDFYSYVTRQIGTDNRPIVVPTFAPGFPIATGADDNDAINVPVWSRFTGTVMPGGTLWFTDDSIPSFGTTSETQVLVGAPNDSIVLLEDEPILVAYPQSNLAGDLEIILILREYCAAVARHASGIATISGVGYQSSFK